MVIGGFLTTTLLDYPGNVAATIFTKGCNFRCPFCQNGDLVLCKDNNKDNNTKNNTNNNYYSENDILTYLSKRRKLLDGVCISGGEPTLMPDLPEFLCKIKDFGLLVKLDTNGTNPKLVKSLYEGHLIDMVAMDIKSSEESYSAACGISNPEIDNIKETIHFLIESGMEYEFRTTLVKGIHTPDDMYGICRLISGARNYFIQNYKDSEKILCKDKDYTWNLGGQALNIQASGDQASGDQASSGQASGGQALSFSAFSKDELKVFLEIARKEIKNATLRGID